MPTTTITISAPSILHMFNPFFFLDPLLGSKQGVEVNLIPLASKKIREQDIGKRKEFDKLLAEYMETYERKKDEENRYKAKVKEAKKRSSIPITGRTCKFKRF